MERFPYEAAEIAVTRLRMAGCFCPARSGKDLALLTEQLREDCEDAGWTPDQLMAAVKAYRRSAPREQVSGAQSAKPWPDIGMLGQAFKTATGGAVKVLDLDEELRWLIELARSTSLQLVPTEGMGAAERLQARSEPVRRRSVALAKRYGQYIPEPVEEGLRAAGGWAKLAEAGVSCRSAFLAAAERAKVRHEVGEGGAPRRAYVREGRPVGPAAGAALTGGTARARRALADHDGLVPAHRGRREHREVVRADQRRAEGLASRVGGSFGRTDR